MKFDEVWKKLCDKRTTLKDDDAKIEFKVENLKTLLRQVYDQGEKRGRDQAATKTKSDPFGSMFGM